MDAVCLSGELPTLAQVVPSRTRCSRRASVRASYALSVVPKIEPCLIALADYKPKEILSALHWTGERHVAMSGHERNILDGPWGMKCGDRRSAFLLGRFRGSCPWVDCVSMYDKASIDGLSLLGGHMPEF